MLPLSATAKRVLTFSTLVIASLSLVLVFPIVANQKALAANLCGSGLASPDTCSGVPYPGDPYPSPLSNFFDGEVFGHGFHHFHGNFGFHHFGGFHHHH
jgi:hypothetical protein